MLHSSEIDRKTVYETIGDQFKLTKKPVKKRTIVEKSGLSYEAVHLAMIWLKRWKLIHNQRKYRRKWYPMRIPNAGICWIHGDRLKNDVCETCERVAQYSYSATNARNDN